MKNSIPKTAGPVATGPDLAEHTSALQWWREAEPYSLGQSRAASLRALLSRVAFLENPDWRLAREGDTARAVRIALPAAANHHRSLLAMDPSFSALLLGIAGGDSTAALPLDRLRRRFVLPRLSTRRES